MIINLKQAAPFVPLIAQWHQDEWAHLNPGESLAGRIERMQRYLNEDDLPQMWVKFVAGHPVATAALVDNDLPESTSRTPWLASVYTEAGNRGRGYAGELVNHVYQQALALGYQHLWLYTPDAAPLYERHGWQVIADHQVYGEAVTIMCR
ncbi:GNAT family N-acetyltransferase [Salinibius halmophilus]|uniref:GNAT family N-acetyltransferase n=1 Tax=Salinibius halmophilus TaxID=1853216 RepID=UPI000E662285|nr:GNAT family N-acetyltransferase [Salinibius halmophilus]